MKDEVSLEEKDVRHPAVLPGDYLRIDVTDDGIGMEESIRLRVFEPSLPPRPSTRAPGWGWPPSTPSSSSTAAGSSVRVSPGFGTTFSVFLPVATDQTAALETAADEAVEGGSETLLFDRICIGPVARLQPGS